MVIDSGGAAMEIAKALVAVFCELSATLTVKFDGPDAVGVPDIAPAADKLKPDGNDPEEIDQEYPPVPPVAERVWLYAAPTVPFGSDAVLTDKGGTVTVSVNACVSDVCAASVTLTVKPAAPDPVGVPLMTPAPERLRPAGKDPDETDHVYAPVPPLAASVWLYAVPKVALGREVVVIRSGGAAANAQAATRAITHTRCGEEDEKMTE